MGEMKKGAGRNARATPFSRTANLEQTALLNQRAVLVSVVLYWRDHHRRRDAVSRLQ
jgi:hypothetical protein